MRPFFIYLWHMSQCIETLINVPTYCGAVEDGTSITSLPGLSLEVADKGASTDQNSGYQMLLELRKAAARELINDFTAQAASKFKAGTLIGENNVGYYTDNWLEQATDAGKYQGIQLYLENDSLLELFIQSVKIAADTVVTTDLLIVDVITGKTLHTIPFTTIADGIVSVDVNKTFKYNRQRINLAFLWDAGLTGTVQSSLNQTFAAACLKCPTWGHNYYSLSARGVKIGKTAQLLDKNFTSTGFTNGMSLSYSIQCGTEGYICQNRNVFELAMLYKFGEKVYQELRFSKRINSVVSYYGKDHEELISWAESNYQKAMDTLVKGLKLPRSICFTCQQQVKTVVRVP